MHLPVLLEEVVSHLGPEPGDVIVDATVGGAGHAKEILRKITPGGKLVAFDRDAEAVKRVRDELGEFRGSFTAVNEDFRDIDQVLDSLNIKSIDGALFDLGMSSFQVDDAARGFSFLREGPLDMRFDISRGMSAAEVVNSFGRDELADIIREYGEERHARAVAGAIAEARKERRIETTGELADIIVRAIGRRYARLKLHPAARTFQALRIHVNDELNAVEEALKKTPDLTKSGGRICVISFHSLEDRIVKNTFRTMARSGELKIVTKKPLTPGEEERKRNPRSSSAKLRVAEKT